MDLRRARHRTTRAAPCGTLGRVTRRGSASGTGERVPPWVDTWIMEPRVGRPTMPGYGVLPEDEGTGLLEWAWAASRLSASQGYWLASVCPDGRPHVTPVWAVFIDDQVWFSSGPRSRKVANIRRSPAVLLTTDDAASPVIAEGEVHETTDPGLVERFASAIDAKYRNVYGVEFYRANATFSVRLDRVIGIDGDDFAGSAPRWTFDCA